MVHDFTYRNAASCRNIEDLPLARLHGRAELIKQSRGELRRLGLARRILQTTNGRLRGREMAQSSVLSPGTHVNSPVFAVTSNVPRRRASDQEVIGANRRALPARTAKARRPALAQLAQSEGSGSGKSMRWRKSRRYISGGVGIRRCAQVPASRAARCRRCVSVSVG
jgi:hypothetical protein